MNFRSAGDLRLARTALGQIAVNDSAIPDADGTAPEIHVAVHTPGKYNPDAGCLELLADRTGHVNAAATEPRPTVNSGVRHQRHVATGRNGIVTNRTAERDIPE